MRWNEWLDGFALLRRQRCTSISQYLSNMNNLATSLILSLSSVSLDIAAVN